MGVIMLSTDHITINTQSSIRIAGSKILYFDPFQIASESHDADIIFLTHDHYDHLDSESIQKVRKEETLFVAPVSMEKALTDITEANRLRLAVPGDEISLAGIQVRAVPAYNKLKPFHPKRNGWTGYVVTMEGITYYVAGDTDAVKELTDISCDIALVPIGGKFTMNAGEAGELINRIQPKIAIPTHYGSIVGRKEDAEVFRNAVSSDICVEVKL